MVKSKKASNFLRGLVVSNKFSMRHKMNKTRKLEDEHILDHTMKIIHLLTGQHYIIIKKHKDYIIESRTDNLVVEPVPYSNIHESNKDKNLCYGKMLGLTKMIIQLLAEEFSSDYHEDAQEEGNKHLHKEKNQFSEHLANLVILVNKMTKDKSQTTAKIFNCTLEIIYLLIGEDYVVVKKENDKGPHSSPCVAEYRCGDQVILTEDPLISLAQEKNSDKKIMDLAKTISQVLMQKVSARCEEDALYSCMEQYLGTYREVYKVDVESEHTLSKLGVSMMQLKNVFSFHWKERCQYPCLYTLVTLNSTSRSETPGTFTCAIPLQRLWEAILKRTRSTDLRPVPDPLAQAMIYACKKFTSQPSLLEDYLQKLIF